MKLEDLKRVNELARERDAIKYQLNLASIGWGEHWHIQFTQLQDGPAVGYKIARDVVRGYLTAELESNTCAMKKLGITSIE